jgi:hypothetical protein
MIILSQNPDLTGNLFKNKDITAGCGIINLPGILLNNWIEVPNFAGIF